ncbi:MAG: complex I NDUFA9 subunit family protein [Rhodoferax sp.]|nr:complex I NDUFA9 subunit family protein [Rhodoferax sp.]
MKNILVLGGTGFVGVQVCEELVVQGWNVTVPTRRRDRAFRVQFLPRLTVLEMSVHDESALARALAGQDAVVNLVAILHGTPQTFDAVHVQLVRKLVAACGLAGVRRLVHISALGADDAQPESRPSEYLRSKSRGEAVLLHTDASAPAPDVTVLRPSVIFGTEDKFLNVFAQLQKVFPFMPLAGAHARFQPVWVEDVARAVVELLQRSTDSPPAAILPKRIEACGPQVFTLAELVQLAGQLAGVNGGSGRPIIALPDGLARLQARIMEMAPGEPLMSRDNLDSMRIDNVASGTVAGLEALGIVPAELRLIAQDYLKGG